MKVGESVKVMVSGIPEDEAFEAVSCESIHSRIFLEVSVKECFEMIDGIKWLMVRKLEGGL